MKYVLFFRKQSRKQFNKNKLLYEFIQTLIIRFGKYTQGPLFSII